MTEWLKSEVLNPTRKAEKGASKRGVVPLHNNVSCDLYIFSFLESCVSSQKNMGVDAGEADNCFLGLHLPICFVSSVLANRAQDPEFFIEDPYGESAEMLRAEMLRETARTDGEAELQFQ